MLQRNFGDETGELRGRRRRRGEESPLDLARIEIVAAMAVVPEPLALQDDLAPVALTREDDIVVEHLDNFHFTLLMRPRRRAMPGRGNVCQGLLQPSGRHGLRRADLQQPLARGDCGLRHGS